MLKDRNSRISAAIQLGLIGDADAVPALIQALKDEIRYVQELDTSAWLSSWDVRQEVVMALGRIGDPSAIPALSEALRDRDSNHVGASAAWALGRIGDASAIPILIHAFGYGSDEFHKDVAEALADIGTPAVSALILTLGKSGSAYYAQTALVKIGHPSVPALTKALKYGGRSLPYAVELLGKVKVDDASSYPALEELMKRGTSIRANAAQTLGMIGGVSVVPALTEALRDEEALVRAYAAAALVNMEPPAVGALI